MPQYILLTGQYMPKPGATGYCIHNIAECLSEDGNDVTVICYSDNLEYTLNCNMQVLKIQAPGYLSSYRSQSKVVNVINNYLSILCKLFHLNKYPLRSSALVRRFARAVEKTAKKEKDITVIASVNPLEAVAAFPLIKKKIPNARLVYYCADTLSNEKGTSGILSPGRREAMGKKWEMKLFEISDLILIMECHKNHYYSKDFQQFRNKMKLVNFPLLKKSKTTQHKENEKTIVYAGTLYRDLRNPSYICSVLPDVLRDSGYKAIFMGGGDCNDILHNAEKASGGLIEYLGLLEHTAAEKHIAAAAVLLSIGNRGSQMAPSKIYEYMATGKPIIHIYSWDGDTCLEPLRKYGNALIIKEGDLDAAEKITAFLRQAVNIDFETVEQIFYSSTPKYTASLIEKI